ncbi:MAG: phage tail assembly chaperone [Pseudomonadota bacterium]
MSEFASEAARLAGLTGAMLGWRPDDFWAATPAELAAVFSALSGDEPSAVPAAQSDLTRLMEQFPDGR